ncbi:MAG TPA: hypothetical protein VNT56_11845 [Acidimicrobiales bacterium]|nr:hypothetical protein [Acidimicrobiales bacterium]
MAPPLDDLAVAVQAAAQRMAVLVRRLERPSAVALGTWDSTDVALHAAQAVETITGLVRGEGPGLDDVSQLATLTTDLVHREGERDLDGLAERIELGALALVDDVRALASGASRTWLVRHVQASPSTILGHVLNELVVHSWDIARAQGVAWPIPGRQAALVLDAFLFPILGHLGRQLVDPVTAAGVNATFDVRIRGGGRHLLRFAGGDLAVESVDGHRPRAGVDCRLSADPSALLLVAWGRRSQWPAIARGQLLAWGRHPWLGLRLRSLLVNP